MIVTKEGIKLMHQYEGLKLKAYLCPAKVWTIGYGNTFYEDKSKVKEGDEITKKRAEELFLNVMNDFAKGVKKLLSKEIKDNQFSALVSLSYNIGLNAFKKSTILKKVNDNPMDKTISDEFIRWNKASGRVLNGLTKRRIEESKMYFSNE